MRKIAILMIMFLVLLSILTACGKNDSTESSSERDVEESFEDAKNGFNDAANGFLEAQESLRTYIFEAERLLDTLTEADIDDPAALEHLRETLDNVNDVVETTIPEMSDVAYKIRQQTRELREQTDILLSLCEETENAVLRVRESQEKY